MKNIILFDLDGTITDPKVGITKSVQHALRYFNINVENPDDLCCFIGPPLRGAFREYYGFSEADANKAVEIYREYFTEKGIFENILYPGMKDLLIKLKAQNKTLILATSKAAVFAERILKHFGIYELFNFISGAELNGERSEKFEVIAYALEKNNIKDLDSCIMVGDRKHDIIGAKKAGIESVGVLYGYGSVEELTEAEPTYIAKNIDELAELFLNL